MDIVLQASDFPDCDVRYINYCRLYFQAISISDLCDAAGTKLDKGVSQGILHTSRSISTLEDPYQERPGPLAWTAWRKFLRLISTTSGDLITPLGDWLFPAQKLRRRWPFLHSLSLGQTFARTDDGQYSFLRLCRYRVYTHESPETLVDFSTLPSDCVPISTTAITDGWLISSPHAISSALTIDSPPQTFPEYIHALPDHERCCLLRYDTFGYDIHDIIARISTFDDYLLVSDGGAIDKYGSHSWVLSDIGGNRWATGSGAAFGLDPKSYRAEISGCKSGLLFLYHAF